MVLIAGSSLEKIRFACLGWGSVFNDNIQRLEDSLLKLSNLLDVSLTSLQDGQVLQWKSALSKWVNVDADFLKTTTTTI